MTLVRQTDDTSESLKQFSNLFSPLGQRLKTVPGRYTADVEQHEFTTRYHINLNELRRTLYTCGSDEE